MWIKSSAVVLPEGVKPGALEINNGKILSIRTGSEALRQSQAVDFGDHAILPGFVDAHVHVNEPGRTEWEGFITATQAAIAGGITTIVDMPLNCHPVTTSVDAFETKKRAVRENLYCDVGFWGGVIPGNSRELEGMVQAGVLGFKCFLIHSGLEEFPNVTDRDLDVALPILSKLQVPLLVHAELEHQPIPHSIDCTYSHYLESRPDAWEVDAVNLVVEKLRKHSDAWAHIVHLSSAEALPVVSLAKRTGVHLTAETCPHYLFFPSEEIPFGDTRFKCAPPIRTRQNQEQLWKGLRDGTLDFIVSDHSPCIPELKRSGSFDEAWGGIASVQLSPQVIWTKLESAGIGSRESRLLEWSRLMALGPAGLAGLSHRKGSFKVGHDADFVVFDPDPIARVEKKNLLFKHKFSPYEGVKLQGRILKTFIRGTEVFDGDTGVIEKCGSFLLGRGK